MTSQDRQSIEQPSGSAISANLSNLLSAEDRAAFHSVLRKHLSHISREMRHYAQKDTLNDNPWESLNHIIPFLMYESIERQEQIAAEMKEYLVSLQSVSSEMNAQVKAMKRESRMMTVLAGLTAALTVGLVVLTVILIWKA